MDFRRIVIVDIASLGIGASPDAKKYHSTKADTLGHLDSEYLLDIPTLQKLGIGNIKRSHPLQTIPANHHPSGFYGKFRVRTVSGTKDASLREMFDFNESLRTLSVFNHLARCRYTTVIISRFISYLANQDVCTQIQSADDNSGFKELMAQLKMMDTGLLYMQVPELTFAAANKDMQGYAARLSIVDKQINVLISALNNTDLLIVTSSFANDPADEERQITREYLPLLVYTPKIETGHSLGVRSTTGDIATTIIDNFKTPSTKLPLGRSLLRSMSK